MRIPRSSIFALGPVAFLAAASLLPVDAWSQFKSGGYLPPFRTSTTGSTPAIMGGSSTDSSAGTSTSTADSSEPANVGADAAALVAMSASSSTVGGPAEFTDDRSNPEQNVIYEVFGGVVLDVCLTIQNRGQLGDVQTVVDGVGVGDSIKPARTRTRCFAAPRSIELRCSTSLCEVVWRIDAV